MLKIKVFRASLKLYNLGTRASSSFSSYDHVQRSMSKLKEPRLTRLLAGVQTRARLGCIAVFVLSVCLLTLLKLDSCASNIQTWHGQTPMAIIFTLMAGTELYFCMPTSRQLLKPLLEVRPSAPRGIFVRFQKMAHSYDDDEASCQITFDLFHTECIAG